GPLDAAGMEGAVPRGLRVTDGDADFFFSSRRRHTRWPRDWSSDVCSSDLCIQFGNLVMEGRDIGTNVFPETDFKYYLDAQLEERSEERRVGKECRSWWSAED